jgi:hypothetical protein
MTDNEKSLKPIPTTSRLFTEEQTLKSPSKTNRRTSKNNDSEISKQSFGELDNYMRIQYIRKKYYDEIKHNDSKWEKSTITVEKYLESKCFTYIFAIAIVLNLLIEDVRLIAIPYEYDYYIEVIKLLLFLFFSTEFLLTFIFIKTFRFSFFFYFDLIAIAGLIPEVHLLYDLHHDEFVKEEKNM